MLGREARGLFGHMASETLAIEGVGRHHPGRMARRRIAVSAIPDDGTSVDQWSVADQCVRRVKRQIAQVATPVVGSTSRKLGQPLVPQKRREPLFAAEVRRRMRRMELARPAKVVVAERDIMVRITRVAFWRATGGLSLGRGRWLVLPLRTALDGGRNGLVIQRGVSGASLGG
jgi:hypothetical protein